MRRRANVSALAIASEGFLLRRFSEKGQQSLRNSTLHNKHSAPATKQAIVVMATAIHPRSGGTSDDLYLYSGDLNEVTVSICLTSERSLLMGDVKSSIDGVDALDPVRMSRLPFATHARLSWDSG